MLTDFWSFETVIWSSLARSILTPPCMLADPANGVCLDHLSWFLVSDTLWGYAAYPPLFTANLHPSTLVNSEAIPSTKTATETSVALSAVTTHAGDTARSCWDQKEATDDL